MRITDQTVEEVRSVADIVEVVGDYVRLKKRGTNFIGLCPFHTEKTPSFNVNPALGIFKCFGCGEGGDVFSFVSRVEQLSFPESVRLLAERYGVEIPDSEESGQASSEQEAILEALRFAARFFHERLVSEPDGEAARQYLKGRGIPPASARRFGLGYAPDRWDGLVTAAEAAHVSPEVLERAGLVLRRREGDGWYDRYRHRLIFPILSHVGKVLGFGGRILVKDPSQPKYVNSPETAVYHKGRVLYGLNWARQAIRGREEAVLVEGYTDVIALHQAGVEHVVASSGTALTPDQVKLLARYAKRVLLLYDADDAGVRATLRGIDLCLEGGLVPYVVALPDGEDPDSFVRNYGGEAFDEYLARHRREFVSYLHDRARLEGRLDAPDSRAEAQHAVVATLSRISDPLLLESYLQQAATVFDVPDVYLRRALRSGQGGRRPERRAPAGPDDPAIGQGEPAVRGGTGLTRAGLETARPAGTPARLAGYSVLPEEKTLIRLMLEHGMEMVAHVLSRTALEEFSEGPAREAAARLVDQYQAGRVDRGPFLDGTFGPEIQSFAAEVMTDVHEPSRGWSRLKIDVPRLNEDPVAAADSAMTLLKLDRLDEMIADARRAVYDAERTGSDIRALQGRLLELVEWRRQVEERKFLV